jgi:hypothetical protein
MSVDIQQAVNGFLLFLRACFLGLKKRKLCNVLSSGSEEVCSGPGPYIFAINLAILINFFPVVI